MAPGGSPARARHTQTLTVGDVPEALGVQQVPQPGHLVLQLSDQLVVGVLVDDGVAADLLGPVGIPGQQRDPWAGLAGAYRWGHPAQPARLGKPSPRRRKDRRRLFPEERPWHTHHGPRVEGPRGRCENAPGTRVGVCAAYSKCTRRYRWQHVPMWGPMSSFSLLLLVLSHEGPDTLTRLRAAAGKAGTRAPTQGHRQHPEGPLQTHRHPSAT